MNKKMRHAPHFWAQLSRAYGRPEVRVVLDIVLIALCLGNSWVALANVPPYLFWVAAVADVALFVRRRVPLISSGLAVVGFAIGYADFAAMIALFSVAKRRPLWQAVLAGIATAAAYLHWVAISPDPRAWLAQAPYATLIAVAPLALGLLSTTRQQLLDRVEELKRMQEHEQRIAAETALARERAVLAREMHDVVSHQVSLIAVQAGALQMSTTDDTALTMARTIRSLSVTTLDELRAMVEVLRAAGGTRRSIVPQPTLDDLESLIRDSGITVHADMTFPDDLSMPVQRAVYRAIQEALTNARKHSTGATVAITVNVAGADLIVTVSAGAATLPVLSLPSSHVGLLGMKERVALLGGKVTASPHPDGSHDLHVSLPHGSRTAGKKPPSDVDQ